jgi:formylglycine-generating enzyme required for sulfatase activity
VLRGGAFNFNVDVCRAAIRYNFAPVNAYFFNGFRLVSSARR